MIEGFAATSVVVFGIVAIVTGLMCIGMYRDSNKGGDFGSAIGAVLSVIFGGVSFVSGLICFIGAIALWFGGQK